MLAVAVPLWSVPPTAFTVIVRVWSVPTGLTSDCGVIWMNASAQCLVALSQFDVQPCVTLPGVPVVRVSEPVTPVKEISEVAETFVVPVADDVILTTQLAVAAPPV